MAESLTKNEFSTEDGSIRLLIGDCLESLHTLPDECINCCVTSPPYWGLRDYGHDGQIGLESTPEAYVAKMVEVFREVRRVLRDDGTLWLNLGDSYAGSGPSGASYQSKTTREREGKNSDGAFRISKTLAARGLTYAEKKPIPPSGLKSKDLIGIPWRVAFALQADGWWLRQDIIWAKPNPMPESVTDRCTKAHEYVFLLSKSAKYWYDAEAVSEASEWIAGGFCGNPERALAMGRKPSGNEKPGAIKPKGMTRNRRSVWTISTKPYSGAHFAVMPSDLVEPCILAGCPEGGTVLDPFAGSGTVAQVAIAHGRQTIACELNPSYGELIQERIRDELDKTVLIEKPRRLVQKSFVEGA